MNYKQAFYSKLEECYLGAKIKEYEKGNAAQSGFSNLLRLKQQYFSHIKAYLDSAIPDDISAHDTYNKLYTFFESYLNDTGTPFFHDTPLYKNIYAKVYTNSKDTSLFYKTKDLYYVKSDTLYTSLTLSDENELVQIYFDSSEYRQNADNTKSKLTFKLEKIENTQDSKPIISIKVLNQKDEKTLFPELNIVVFKQSNEFKEEFLKELKTHKIPLDEENLKKLFTSYKKQNEVDFFIHKNAKAFLTEQFDLWAYRYLYKDSAFQEWSLDSIAHLQKIRNIALEVIGLIGDFEEELKAIWLKPKFAKKVEYVFSFDLIVRHSVLSDKSGSASPLSLRRMPNTPHSQGLHNPNFSSQSLRCQDSKDTLSLLDSIFDDKGFESQVREWQDLKLIDESAQSQNIRESILSDEAYRFLPLDTRHFSKETRYQILNAFDDIESTLNGELIKADNFQALNTLLPKYQNKVDLIYIDPPYNTGNDGFIYVDKFHHTSWLSMIANRLELARGFLKNSGSIFISIDDTEQAYLKILCDSVFGEENFVSNVIWEKKYSPSNDAKYLSDNHDFIISYAKYKEMWKPNLLPRTEEMNARYKNLDNDPRGEWKAGGFSVKTYSESYDYPITTPSGKVVYPPSGSCWQTSKENYEKLLRDNRIYFGKNNDSKPQIKQFLSEVQQGVVPKTLWRYDEVGHNQIAKQEIKLMFDDEIFDTPKPEKLLKRILEIATTSPLQCGGGGATRRIA